jgi:hypothetical protein
MRTYANFLLFEDVLSNLPPQSVILTSAANTLMNPITTLIEEDCGTTLGTLITTIDYSIVGLVELATGAPITVARISQLQASGTTQIRVRSVPTCISHGGVCATCYSASYGINPRLLDGTWQLDGTVMLTGRQLLAAGTTVQLPSMYVYDTDIITGDGISTSYAISQTTSDYDATSFNPITSPEVAYITDTNIVFNTVRTPSDIYVLHFLKYSSDPFLEYMAKSFSGSLLGISPLSSYPLTLRPSVYQSMFSPSQIAVMKSELFKYSPTAPQQILDYCDTIRDPLEQVLLILYLYAVFANIS